MSNHSKAGFVLFEVGLVLCLVVIFCSLAIVHTSFFERQLLKTEVEKLSQFIWFSARRAQASGTEKVIIFNESDHSYACDQYQEKLARGIEFGSMPHALGPPSKPSREIASGITYTHNSIIVRPDGTMESGALYLTNGSKNLMYALTTPVTSVSYIRKYRYHKNQWQLI